MKSLILVLFFSFGTLAQTHEPDYTPSICLPLETPACAHLDNMKNLTSVSVGSFVVHIEVPGHSQVTDMKVALWMPSMHHGTAPVKVTEVAPGKYQVTEAYFIMPGDWTVQLRFTIEGQVHQIDVPLTIK